MKCVFHQFTIYSQLSDFACYKFKVTLTETDDSLKTSLCGYVPVIQSSLFKNEGLNMGLKDCNTVTSIGDD